MFSLAGNQEHANQSNSQIPLYCLSGWQKLTIDNVKVQINWKTHALM